MNYTGKEINFFLKEQLALDCNCSPDDFEKEGIVFCEAKQNANRRPFPWSEPHFEMLHMGASVVVSASAKLLPYLQEQLAGKNRDEAFEMPFVIGMGLYYLPDKIQPLPLTEGFIFEFIERSDIPAYYKFEGFKNTLQYDVNHSRPDVLAMIAKKDNRIIGMAGASIDCKMFWQIGIDILPDFRRFGLAAVLTNALAIEILERGKIPYYGTSASNIASQRVAHRAGLQPAWVCSWRGRFDGKLTEPTC